MRRIDLEKFLAENPPSYGVPVKDEFEKRVKRRVALLISVVLSSAVFVSLYKAFSGGVDVYLSQ